MSSSEPDSKLVVVDASDIVDPVVEVIPDTKDPELVAEAEKMVDAILALDPASMMDRRSGVEIADDLGASVQRESAKALDLLQAPVERLMQQGEAGGQVGTSLADLKIAVERTDPRQFNFEPGWLSRMAGYLPFVGTPIKRFLTRYESTRTVIDSIVNSLDQGRQQLRRDNVVLEDDQTTMRGVTEKLTRAAALGQRVDERLSAEADALSGDTPQRKFIEEEVLFPLRQRVIDLQQQLAVNQQGILATEIVSRNNRELIRGVDRAINVTSRALKVAATVAIALADQKAVIDKVNTVNDVTSDLIAGTAEQLKTQGAEIQKQASTAMIDVASLKSAFADIDTAIEDLATFRSAALPKMAASVAELDAVTTRAAESIDRMDAARQPEGAIQADV